MIDSIIQWDKEVLLFFQEHIRADWLNPVMKVISSIGWKGIIWIVLCIVLMIIKKTRMVGIVAASSLSLSFIVNNLTIKVIVDRIRPYEVIESLERIVPAEIDASFPSGHVACVFSVAVGILLASKNKVPGILLIIFGFLMAFSRMYVGVHYPTDVIGAAVIASLCALAAYYIVRFIDGKIKKKRQDKNDIDAMMV